MHGYVAMQINCLSALKEKKRKKGPLNSYSVTQCCTFNGATCDLTPCSQQGLYDVTNDVSHDASHVKPNVSSTGQENYNSTEKR